MYHLTTTNELLEKFLLHSYISTDSRKVMPGSLFFALKGDNFNANLFAEDALKKGAAYAIIDEPDKYLNDQTLVVEDVLQALQSLASLYRSLLKIPIIGITGTNGKTTTKELIATALTTRFSVVATPGNLNNHIGVPLTLLSIKPDTEVAVVEMGANHPGEIAHLCSIARPTHGLITNIGKAHLEGFGGFEGVIKAKKELYDYLNKAGGRVFVNSGNELLMQLSSDSYRTTYGLKDDDEVSGFPGSDEKGYLAVSLKKPSVQNFSTNLAGTYNFENVMAALCIAHQFRVDIDTAINAIAGYQPDMNRSQIKQTTSNLLILDAYNANPSSMKVALENFNKMKADNKVIILGDMFELGNESLAEHQSIVNLIAEFDFTKIYTAGPYFYKATDGNPRFNHFLSTEELKLAIEKETPQNATILIKGSRGMKLETITGLL